MKNTWSAFNGSLPSNAKITKPVASMAAAAISGAAMRIQADGAARFSRRHGSSSMRHPRLPGAVRQGSAGHQQADGLDVEMRAGLRRGQPAGGQHGNPVAD